ncbi:MFS transporter [Streptomyces caniferus]|uniref:MFS transporter n=1 Tax=Streptomyces caniferus TaxID=285557 RepID=A0A640SNI3_9ACTN|nr:MFS transporter [Streptomyces caniferus]GFE11015.1 MFS transporter [Streptomyces caniferus]
MTTTHASQPSQSPPDRQAPSRPSTPLWRNRDYNILWISRSLTEVGFNASTMAFPLLVLAVTRSPGTAGLVQGVNAAAQLLAGLPGGTLVDRWNRKTVMLTCEAARTVALLWLVWTIWTGAVAVWHMAVVAAVLGVCSALFDPAEEASLPYVVPPDQLAVAVSMNHARNSIGHLVGTALSGALFGVKRVLPFAADALTHVVSFFMLLFVRLPKPERQAEGAPPANFRREALEGLKWVWGHRLIRVTAMCAVAVNFLFQVLYLVIIVVAQQSGVPSAQIGVMAAMFGGGGLLGALAAPRLYARCGPRVSVVLTFWAMAVLAPVTLATGNGIVMGLVLAGIAFLAPTANTAVSTYQLLTTPDRLRGRLSGVIGLIAGISTALGPLTGGLLMECVGARWAILLSTLGIAVLAVTVTLSPTLRGFGKLAATPPAEDGTGRSGATADTHDPR